MPIDTLRQPFRRLIYSLKSLSHVVDFLLPSSCFLELIFDRSVLACVCDTSNLEMASIVMVVHDCRAHIHAIVYAFHVFRRQKIGPGADEARAHDSSMFPF